MPSSACKTCARSEEHTSELQSHDNLVCRLLLEKKEPHPPHHKQTHVDPRPPATPSAARHGRRAVSGWPVGAARRGDGGVRGARFFFFNEGAPPEFYPLSLPDALPI